MSNSVIMASIIDEPSSSTVAVMLTEEDIPRAKLHEPFKTHAILTLQWWLLCRGIKTPSSWKSSVDQTVSACMHAVALFSIPI